MMPSQNGGMPSPNIGTARIAWSRAPSFLVAASVASGTAISTAKIVGQTSSHSVRADRSMSSVATSSRRTATRRGRRGSGG